MSSARSIDAIAARTIPTRPPTEERVTASTRNCLEARGFTVFLVNAHHVKNVPGRKSDVSDCQWLQYLHAVGLLRASFRPEQAVCSVRSILRHRDSLVQMPSSHVQHMQKALDQMNLQLHHVISDITGVTGVAILECGPQKLRPRWQDDGNAESNFLWFLL